MSRDRAKSRRKKRSKLRAKIKRNNYKRPDSRLRNRLIRGQRGGKRR